MCRFLGPLQNGSEACIDAIGIEGQFLGSVEGFCDALGGEGDVCPSSEGFLRSWRSSIPNGISVSTEKKSVNGGCISIGSSSSSRG